MSWLLHHHFIDVAKKMGAKLAIHDSATNRKIPYNKALIASIILAGVFRKFDKGNIGIMIPTSAGCILTKLCILMSGRTPVMINYSTGAEQNARYAQKKCDFRTIITSKALLEKIEDILEKLLPEDAHCCVVEIPDAIKGARIVAVVTTKIDQKATLKQLAAHLAPISLPKTFLVMENLPKMGSGKIDFRAITELARERS